MTIKKHGLGRGLSDLGVGGVSELLSEVANSEQKSELRKLPVDLLQPGKYQPRQEMDHDALQELANSIRNQGIIQPIVVRPITAGKYEIIAGERRWRAAQLAELHEVPAVVREIPDEAAVAISLIENIQREDLNAIEEAVALQRLQDEFQMTHQEVADAVGRSRTSVTNLLRLLALPKNVRTMVEHGDLEMGHARALLTLDPELQLSTAQLIIAKEMSVRETESLIRRVMQPKKVEKHSVAMALDPNINNLQTKISDHLGAKTSILHTAKGKGKMVVHYNSLDELDGIIAKVMGKIGEDWSED